MHRRQRKNHSLIAYLINRHQQKNLLRQVFYGNFLAECESFAIVAGLFK